ncbi:MAG: hypothetical protein P4L44_10375 [Oryzomonas sp.]|uniref:hypothetical protein n=1 Tax=Oryzomonas sp. TaxID=2855186 RepID=UPI0028506F73|nr:hypothetical protein [Oryzomonas sp.]MDR3580356.1 hypothetical protein [Oryzomonas sp.]
MTGLAPGLGISFFERNSDGRSAVLRGMTKTGYYTDEDKDCRTGWECERQVGDGVKRYRDIGGAMVGNGADGTIIVVVASIVVVMEGGQQDREQHKHRQRKRNNTAMLPVLRDAVPGYA